MHQMICTWDRASMRACLFGCRYCYWWLALTGLMMIYSVLKSLGGYNRLNCSIFFTCNTFISTFSLHFLCMNCSSTSRLCGIYGLCCTCDSCAIYTRCTPWLCVSSGKFILFFREWNIYKCYSKLHVGPRMLLIFAILVPKSFLLQFWFLFEVLIMFFVIFPK